MPWHLAESAELLFQVEQMGEGNWAAIKRAGMAGGWFMERTPADLRDQWRILKADEDELEEAN